MRVVAFTPIWPNRFEPLLGPYNVLQLKPLVGRCEIAVVCAIPYFPFAARTGQPPRAAQLASLPERDTIEGIETHYLRQLYLPKLGVPVAVPLALASLSRYRSLAATADVILGTWAYPHGCAAVLLAKSLGKRSVVKVHGSDLNVVARMASARAVLRRVLPRADAMVTMSRALGLELEALGVAPERVHLVQNGVDPTLFAVRDRAEARAALGLPPGGSLILYVGSLKREKGVSDLLAAFEEVRAKRPDATLVLVGEGPARKDVEARRAAWGSALVAPGGLSAGNVARWMAACDVFTLPSWMEGQPNVVLEALASGRPVVATRVGGIPDALASADTGLLVEPKDPAGLATALLTALGRAWSPERIAAAAPGSWAESAERLYAVLRG